MGNRLYVGNLAFGTNEETVRNAFGQAGEVTDVRIMMDRETGRPRGFASSRWWMTMRRALRSSSSTASFSTVVRFV
jgi:hypothetical protein